METIIGQPPEGAGDLIKESTTASFAEDVIEASRQVPVLVDFWAPWCEPCKQLTPVMEKLVKQARGAVRLVKINIDENPELAQQLRVQSIPMVVAFKNGQPVDGFTGAQPESQIAALVTRLAGDIGPSPTDQMLADANAALSQGDAALAGQMFQQIIAAEPENTTALSGLVGALIELGQLDHARTLLAEQSADNAAFARVRAALALAEESQTASSAIAALEEKQRAQPKDHETLLELAIAYWGAREPTRAVETLLESIRLDRKWNDAAARKKLLQFFEALGPDDPITQDGRRQLSSILFS